MQNAEKVTQLVRVFTLGPRGAQDLKPTMLTHWDLTPDFGDLRFIKMDDERFGTIRQSFRDHAPPWIHDE